MTTEVKIEKIMINVNGKLFELTRDEAEELRKVLNNFLKNDDDWKVVPYIPYYPPTIPTWLPYVNPIITCGDNFKVSTNNTFGTVTT